MKIYNDYQEDIKQMKQKYLIVKNCELPEEYLINKYEQQQNDSEEISLFEEKVKKIRPNLNFNQGYYDTTTDQYQKQYRNSYSQYQSSSSQRQFDENITEQTYFSQLRMKNILVPDRFFKYPKIDFFIFPMIYQFILHQISNVQKDIEINDENNFRLQNFLFQLLLSEKQTISNQKRARGRKGYFQEIEKENTIEEKEDTKLTVIKKDKTLSLIQDNDDNDSDNQNDDQENSQQNYPNKQSPSPCSSQHQLEKENEKKYTKNIKSQRASLRNEYLDAFAHFCSQKFVKSFIYNKFLWKGFIIQNYYSSSLVEASKREKTLIFNTIKLGSQNIMQDENQSTEKLDELPNLNEQKSNISINKSRGKRKVASKNKNNISLQIDTMEVVDYFTLKVNELLIYYVKNYEHFIDNYKIQLKEYVTLNNQANNKQVIGAFSKQEEIDLSIQQYQEYLSNPNTLKMRGYLYHSENREKWTEEQYKKFLDLYLKYMKYPVNNRRIATEMGNNIHQNHVKYEKQPYMIGLRKRALQNQIPLQEQVKRDIENFSLTYFQKPQKLAINSDGSPSDPSDNLNDIEAENEETNEEFEEEDDEEDEEDDEDEENDDKEGPKLDQEDEIDEENDGEDSDDDDDEDDDEDEEDYEEDEEDDDIESDGEGEGENDEEIGNNESNGLEQNIEKIQGNNQAKDNKEYQLKENGEKNSNQDLKQSKNNKKKLLIERQKKGKGLQKKERGKNLTNDEQKKQKKRMQNNQISDSFIPHPIQKSSQKIQKLSISDEEIVLSEDGSKLDTDELSAQLDEFYNQGQKKSSDKKEQKSNKSFSLSTKQQQDNVNNRDMDDLNIDFSDDDDNDDFGESNNQRKKRKQSVDDDSLSL